MSLQTHRFGSALTPRNQFVRQTIATANDEPAECAKWRLWTRSYGDANDSTVLCDPLGTQVTDTVTFPFHQTLTDSTRLIFDPVLAALRAGTTSVGSTAWSVASTGMYSAAFGLDTVASGEGSVVVGGQGGQATGAYSLAMNGAALASGDYSLAVGPYAQATHSGSFVFSDSVDPTGAASHLQPASSAADEVTIVAAGGIGVFSVYTGAPVVTTPGTVSFVADTSSIAGDLTATGPLDPTGLQLTSQAAGAIPTVADGTGIFWSDDGADTLQFTPDGGAAAVQLDTGNAGSGGGAFNYTLTDHTGSGETMVRLRAWAADASPTPDFVFPATGTTETYTGPRLQFTWADKALRAGRCTGANDDFWNASNRGLYSMGFGQDSRAQGDYSSVLAGDQNRTTGLGDYSVVGAGQLNSCSGPWNVIVGGNTNETATVGNDTHATILGGTNHECFSHWSFIGGGTNCGINRAGATPDAPYAGIGCGNNPVQTQDIYGGSQSAAILTGRNNRIGDVTPSPAAFVAGGQSHDMDAAGGVALAGGTDGQPNLTQGERSFVITGRGVSAVAAVDAMVGGDSSSVAGQGSFSYGDSVVSTLDYCVDVADSNGLLASTAASSWTAGFANGFQLFTAALPDQAAAVATVLNANDTAWSVVSDRAKKRDVEALDLNVVDRLRQLPVYQYNYRGGTAVNRGPTAQDWHRLFPLAGKDEKRIDNMELDTIVLAGIKELAARVRELERQVDDRARYADELVDRLAAAVPCA